MKNKIIFFILLILLVGCVKSGNYEVKNLSVNGTNSLQKILGIANEDNEVKSILQDIEYSVEIKKADQNERQKTPYLYKGLNGDLYKVTYKTNKFDLIAITNEKEVLGVFLINKVVI